jgi:hypothetical protein
MRTKVKVTSPEVVLARVLEGLEQELIDASDEEVLQAAKDLGMNPQMRGSAAFIGLTTMGKPQLSDFFDVFEAHKTAAQVASERPATEAPKPLERKAPQSRQPKISRDRKDSGDK